MRFENLKKSLTESISPVYLIEGEDAFFRERASELIKKATLKEPDINYTRFSGADLKVDTDKLLMDMHSFPFMSEYRVVEVFDWQPTAAEIKGSLKAYFDSPDPTTVLIIVNKAKSDNLKKQNNVCLVECNKADLDLITRYIRSKALAEKLIVSNSVCKKIADYSLNDMAKIDGEVNKLIDYCRGEAEISDEAGEKVVTKETDYKIFEIIGFIARKNYAKAYEVLKDFVTPSDKQSIITSLYYHFRRMFYAKVHGGDHVELARLLGDHEYVVRKAKEQSSAFSAKRLKDITEKLGGLDAKFKRGELTVDGAFDIAVNGVLTMDQR